MQTTPFLDRKLTRRFHTYDLDGNGFIEQADFEEAARRLGEEFGHAPDSPQRRRLDDLCMQLWQGLAKAADIDGDGRIDEDEYKAAFTALVLQGPGAFDEVYVPFIDAVIDIADSDGDGQLDLAEHMGWFRALLGVSEEDSAKSFRMLDRDGDGVLTREEIRESIREYYSSEDLDAPGNWLLGPPPQ